MKQRNIITTGIVLLLVAAGFWIFHRDHGAEQDTVPPLQNNARTVTGTVHQDGGAGKPSGVEHQEVGNAVRPATIASSKESRSVSPYANIGRQPPPPTPASATPPPPQGDRAAVMLSMDKVKLMLRDYRTLMGENPVGTNAEIMRAVIGGNPRGARLGPPEGVSLNGSGELVDPWGTPYFFHQLSGSEMEIRSAGEDRKMWTSDDVILK
jgi:hypothetical protein